MAFRRLSAAWVASLCSLVVACSTEKPKTTDSTPTPVLTVNFAGSKGTLAKGEAALLVVRSYISTNGTETPLPGEVTFEIPDNLGSIRVPEGLGTNDPPKLVLTTDANNQTTATVEFIMCDSGPKCVGNTMVPITASIKDATGKQLADSASTAFTLEKDPDASCDPNDESVCTQSKCKNAACSSILGQGKCDADTKVCVVPAPNDGEVQVELGFDYLPSSPNYGKVPPITALPKGADAFNVTARLKKVSATSTVDLSKLKVKFTLAGSGVSPAPGTVLDEASSMEALTTVKTVTADATVGAASARVTPSLTPASGSLTVTVLNEDNSPRPRLVDTRPMNVVVPGTLVFAAGASDQYYRTLGVKGGGFQEQSTLRFALLDSSGNPWRTSQGEVTVNFELIGQPGGLSLSPLVAKLDTNGQVTTTVYAGHTRGMTVVRATATIGGTTLQTNSETIVVVGAKAASKNFAVSCEKAAISALSKNDCTLMRSNLSVVCTAVLADRNNNPVGRNARVSWSTEAGLIGLPTSTPLADPDQPTTEAVGKTSNVLRTFNARVPYDTVPMDGEPRVQRSASDTCYGSNAALTHYNPRDGLVTIVAYTQGEESFDDLNGNGIRDANEPFDDLPEPFVDADDNGVRDPGEEYVDVNGNNQWDGPNGLHDTDAVIWTTGHVAFTGDPTATITSDIDVTQMSTDKVATLSARWEDRNLNDPAATATAYTAQIVSGDGNVAQVSPERVPDRHGAMRLQTVRELNGTTNTYSYRTLVTFASAPQQIVKYLPPGPTTTGSGTGGAVNIPAPTVFQATAGLTATVSDAQTVVQATKDIRSIPPVCTNAAGQPAVKDDANCALSACADQSCSISDPLSGNATGTCRSSVCDPSQAGSKNYVLNLTFVSRSSGATAPQRLTAGGEGVLVTAKVTNRADGTTASGVPITFDISNDVGVLETEAGAALGTTHATTSGADGLAKVVLEPGTQPAKGIFTIAIDGISVRRIFDVVVPGTLQFTPGEDDAFSRLMGIKSSGWNEQNVLRFTLLDSTGQPYLGEAEVEFSVSPLGGARLVPTKLKIDSNGQVVTQLYSGVQSGTLSVTAKTTINGQTLTVQSDTVAVVGAKANGRNFAMRCDKLALPALLSNNCSYTFSDFTASCTAVLGDRFNNTLGRNTRVTWLSEAGLFGPPSSTPIAEPNVDPSGQPNLGRTVNTLRTLSTPLPLDVNPDEALLPGETARMPGVSSACPGTTNLRDGLVTLIAATEGEEGFVDTNNNGQWDAGEKFYDLGEPFVDANDNGEWDSGELYIDVDGNGTYTGANGQWDANTTIWTTSYVAYTGLAGPVFQPATMPFVDYDSSFNFAVDWRDVNGNEPAPTFSTYGLSLAPGNGTVQIVTGANRLDQVGSINISNPTVCGDNPSAPDACRLTTTMRLNSRVLVGRYTAPTSQVGAGQPVKPLGDTIIASVSSPDGSLGTIVMSGSTDVASAAAPVISALEPSGGPPGTLVTVLGSNLNGSGSTLYFQDSSGVTIPMTLASVALPTQLTFRIPTNARGGTGRVWVQNAAGGSIADALPFVVGTAPTITSFTPNAGIPGTTRVTVIGAGFTVSNLRIFIGDTQIEPTTNGDPSPVFYRVADQLRFLVPTGVRSGPITIMTDAGSFTTTTSFEIPLPTIVSFAPAAAAVGEPVTVTGTGLHAGGLLIDVAGVIADENSYVISPDGTTVTFTVPAGATDGLISITTSGGGPVSSTDPLLINP